MIGTMVRGAVMAAVLPAAITQAQAAEPAKLYAATVESGGIKTGCVRYVPEVVRSAKHHVLRFAFVNECDRAVLVRIGTQFGTREGSWSQMVQLKSGAMLQGSGRVGNWVGIDWLRGPQRFTVMQAELGDRNRWPSLAGCKPHPRVRDAPCPPMISID